MNGDNLYCGLVNRLCLVRARSGKIRGDLVLIEFTGQLNFAAGPRTNEIIKGGSKLRQPGQEEDCPSIRVKVARL